MERYLVKIDGRERTVDLEEDQNGLRVTVDGRERIVDARPLAGGGWSLLDAAPGAGGARLIAVDGKSPKLTIEVSHPDGEPRLAIAEVTSARSAAAVGGGTGATATATGATGPITLRAPIPGKVVKVLVRPAERVKAGQPLVVIEAMKMENELRAPRDATVVAIQVAEGAAVETGQPLVSLD